MASSGEADGGVEEAASRSSEEEMVLAYNDKFPEELKAEMLARVAAVTQLLRLRLVCKAWNGMITSPNLARLHAARHEEPWLLLVKRASNLLYVCDPSSPNMDHWFAPPLPHCPHELDLSTCTSNGGLICCMATSRRTIFIFNPITRAYKVIPAPPRFDCLRSYDRRRVVQEYDEEEAAHNLDLTLWRCKRTGHFKVAICNRVARGVRVFDSMKGLWRQGSSPPDAGGSRPRFQGFRDRMCREKLYWYDVEMDAWIPSRLPGGEALRRPCVFKGDGSVIMLAALLPAAGRGVAGFGVWSVGGGGTWKAMSTTPPALALHLHRLKDSRLICHSRYVCLTGLLRFSIWPWNCFYPCILTFSAIQETWSWLPHRFGPKTWAKFHAVSIFTPSLGSVVP